VPEQDASKNRRTTYSGSSPWRNKLRSVLRFRGQVRPAGGEATAANPVLYGVGAALLLAMGVAGAGAPSAAAGTRHASRPCGVVTFEYSAARVHPGEAMDMDLFLGNCSHRPERLRVQVRSHGPCRFFHPVEHTYSFRAQSGVEQSVLMLVPSCNGRYSAHVKLTLAGQHRVLDVASDGFVVHQH
jgi:hypothetical protein